MLGRIISSVLAVLICFVLQCSVFDKLALGGIVPNLLIILTSAYGFMRGEKAGIITGFFCGFLMDIFFGNFLGFYSLLYMYIGFVNGKFEGIFYPEDIKLSMSLILCSDLSLGLVNYILLFLLRGRFEFWYYFRHVILAETVYTLVAAVVLFPIVLFVERKIEDVMKRSR